MRNYSVATRYGGGFVQSIDGLSGAHDSGAPVDWFYYVNGVQAGKGAAATNVHPGDHIWWDRHDWSQTEDVPAVVGSFPEPFLNGIEGKRLPVRIECEDVGGPACDTVNGRLQRLGVPAAVAALGNGGSETLRVLVAAWPRVRVDVAASALGRGPRASGVYARFQSDGSLSLLDDEGRVKSVLSGAAGLIAATRYAEDAPAWIVTGTDPMGVQLAARDFSESALRDRFAVAVTRSGAVGLPVGASVEAR